MPKCTFKYWAKRAQIAENCWLYWVSLDLNQKFGLLSTIRSSKGCGEVAWSKFSILGRALIIEKRDNSIPTIQGCKHPTMSWYTCTRNRLQIWQLLVDRPLHSSHSPLCGGKLIDWPCIKCQNVFWYSVWNITNAVNKGK